MNEVTVQELLSETYFLSYKLSSAILNTKNIYTSLLESLEVNIEVPYSEYVPDDLMDELSSSFRADYLEIANRSTLYSYIIGIAATVENNIDIIRSYHVHLNKYKLLKNCTTQSIKTGTINNLDNLLDLFWNLRNLIAHNNGSVNHARKDTERKIQSLINKKYAYINDNNFIIVDIKFLDTLCDSLFVLFENIGNHIHNKE